MARRPVWEEMGLTGEEYARILSLLGREPNFVELGMFAVLWSEHCAYKNSRPVLRLFPTTGKHVLQGPGENAGAVDIGDGLAVVFKIESHNHPSAIEPYQGAATGVGGIVRDIFAMGARPIALLNSLRFGDPRDAKVRYLFSGVVAGIAGYGNCIGVPTVGGEVYFHPCYTHNPLVNAMCVGLVEHRHLKRGRAAGIGNPVLLVGAKTGRDGIHGATFASAELDAASEEKRPAVQVGDPFLEKLLIEACLEAAGTGFVVGMQDLGAAGITSACAETAARAGTGVTIDVSKVPRREEGMTPYEVLLSESQERMLIIPEKGREEEVAAIFAKWGLDATVIGEVTGDGIFRVFDGEELVAEVPVRALVSEAPVYHRTPRLPEYYEERKNWPVHDLPVPRDLGEVLLQLLGSPSLASKEWVWRQYDHMVLTNTVVRPGADAAVLRVKGTGKGLALTTDGNSRYCYLDPYRGGMIAVCEAARNLACVGAEPLGLTDCLNFGNPEKPEVFWQFLEVVKGMSVACRFLGVPVVSGNVSFYNETSGVAVYPTPVVGMVGLLPEVSRFATLAFKDPGDLVVLLGEVAPHLGASEYLALVHGVEAGEVPPVVLALEKAVQECCRALVRRGLVKSAHDCAEGGIAVAIAECCLAGGLGASVDLPADARPDACLFGEAQSRIIVTCTPRDLAAVEEEAARHGVPCRLLGSVGGERLRLKVGGRTVVDLHVEEMKEKWSGSLPELMK